jgi:glycerol-3-phosphate acyltransferase PlsY
MFWLCIAFAIIVPYLLCSINPAIIVTKIKSGEDIRKIGSGNAGFTNVLRTQGKSAAAIVMLIDVLKGVAAIWLVVRFTRTVYTAPHFSAMLETGEVDLLVWIAALATVLGHCFPIYYKFKGGKAVLVTVATGFAINWIPTLIALLVFIVIVAITRYVSLGSIVAVAVYAIASGIFGGMVAAIFAGAIAAVIIIMHRGNIKRLIAGNEKKLGKKETA